MPSASEIFACADCRQKGYITFDEFVALMFDPDSLDEAEKMEFFKAGFSALAQGEPVTLEELVDFFGVAADAHGAVTDLFATIDADGDGLISEEEFVTYVSNL